AEKLLERQGVQDEDLSRTITVRVRECFRALGQYGDLSREMAERASPDSGDSSLAGRQVVAEIGGDKITVADFDRIVAAQVELAVRSQWGLTPEEADAARQRAYERLADPQAKARHLQQIVMTRVIANEARKQNLEESAGFRERLVATADAMLADTLIGEEISKRATVTEADIQRYYEANKDRYAEPATTRVARILCGTQEEAQALLERARAGEDFAELARANSSDAQTRDNGGELPRPVSEQGDLVPGIGSDAELHGRIWAAAPGDLLAEPYRSAAGWEVIKVLDRTARKERPLDEVRDRVEYDTRLARRQEVSEQYVTELMKSAGVKVYPEAFSLGGSEAKPEAQSP
ncbi:MAG: peptidyl-prolyl cis-trans isomerase, partial [Phycisphaerae bacterium]|nr:peptidyl-prolyl cis-trans isomerase [Phycisphaerae bacterium]